VVLSLGALTLAPGLAFAAAAPAAPSAPASPPASGSASVPAPAAEPLDLQNTLYLDLEYGRVVIKMHPELAPKHVARIKELVRQGFYDGLIWHRVIEGFMAQGGDPKGDGTGGSGQNIPAEFNGGRHTRGALSMARAANINSADSQFYIVLQDSPHLNGQYTYWGEVVSGMEFVDRIRKGDPESNGMVPYPDRIIRMQVAADAEKAGDKWPREPAAAPKAK
jgi:peptidylprolyl isomerase